MSSRTDGMWGREIKATAAKRKASEAPPKLFVQLMGDKKEPCCYTLDPREVHDNGKPVYVYQFTETLTRTNDANNKRNHKPD